MVLSVAMRVVCKISADFTGMLHMRHPLELGGAYWLFNMVYTQLSVLVVLRLGHTVKGAVVSKNALWVVVLCLSSLWFISIIALFLFSERALISTFYSTLTSKQFQFSRSKGGDDRTK